MPLAAACRILRLGKAAKATYAQRVAVLTGAFVRYASRDGRIRNHLPIAVQREQVQGGSDARGSCVCGTLHSSSHAVGARPGCHKQRYVERVIFAA